MKLQKHFASKVEDKTYYKYVLVLPKRIIKDADLKEGDELEAEVGKKGEVRLKKK